MSDVPEGYVRGPIRIAIRSEGEFVNAYLAPLDSMDGAMLMATIRRSLLRDSDEAFEKWRSCLQDGLTASIRAVMDGAEPVWPEQPEPAPEHERGGRA